MLNLMETLQKMEPGGILISDYIQMLHFTKMLQSTLEIIEPIIMKELSS